MELSDKEIMDKLTELLKPYNPKNIEINEKTDVAADLEMESVSIMEFVMEAEDAFEIDIPVTELSETESLGDLVKIVKAGVK